MSSLDSLACLRTLSIACPGAVVNHFGSCANEQWEMIRAIGLILYFSIFSFEISTTAAAPSFNFDALAAVMVPFFSNTGLMIGIFSNFALPGSSSESIAIPLEFVNGIISLEK